MTYAQISSVKLRYNSANCLTKNSQFPLGSIGSTGDLELVESCIIAVYRLDNEELQKITRDNIKFDVVLFLWPCVCKPDNTNDG